MMQNNLRAIRRGVFISWRHREKINEEFKLDVRKEYFDECFDEHDLESMSDEEKNTMRGMIDDWMCYIYLGRR